MCPASLNVIRYDVRNGSGPIRRVPSTQMGYIGAEETLRMSRLASWELHPFGLDPVFVSFAGTGKQVKSASAPPCEPSPRSLSATCPYDGVHGLGSRRRTPHRCLAPRASHPIPAIKGHRAHLPFLCLLLHVGYITGSQRFNARSKSCQNSRQVLRYPPPSCPSLGTTHLSPKGLM